MTLAEIITTGMNNPDCSFFVGATVGQMFSMKMMMILFGSIFVFKFLDGLVINPILNFLKNKLFNKKKK